MADSRDREFIFVFTGPDGSGRKTIADSVGSTLGLTKVLSYATRKPRPGEVNGQDYHFITPELYEELDASGDFIESVTINSNQYGIRDNDIRRSFRNNGCIYLIVNAEGADMLKQIYGTQVVRLFIYADRGTVEERQRQEGISGDVIEERLSRYETDMAAHARCEHAFENYDLAHTVFEITNTLEQYLQRNLEERD
ncbi:guanylate kinase [Paenibacillus nasutitermitis]|uniref:Guanylate kinase n=1 Tax=Paenibacillus nasutitermitis TaxID=1652958 RepID=A0A916ZBX8_9BACL|nr:guanylate kinase [Paenibacillus nasutitermitis]GGD85881.1 guanylate kinase [Paenibacillus nasutitermitis]